jgi:azurin
MAFLFESKSWSATGEQTFEAGELTLNNPTIHIEFVTLHNDNIYMTFTGRESGSSVEHNFVVSYTHDGSSTNVDSIVDTAIAAQLSDFSLT